MSVRASLARPLCALAAALGLALAAPVPAASRDTLTIGITQYPSTLHPSIESMAAKSYVHGFTLRPVTVHDAEWTVVCMLCERLPTIENGDAVP